MKTTAEFVSAGHPDRICDAVVEAIVQRVAEYDERGLAGIECAVNRDELFIDGRIAVDNCDELKREMDTIIRNVFQSAGYNDIWKPDPKKLKIINAVDIGRLDKEERKIRSYSDDQNIVTGFAVNSPHTRNLPIAHYVANTLGMEIQRRRNGNDSILGPDFKLLVIIDDCDNFLSWNRLVFSCQHSGKVCSSRYLPLMRSLVTDSLLTCFKEGPLSLLSVIEEEKFYINGAGDFITGGPYGDNGLSGKKLAIDFYGPEVPIGGGAICGKDAHKVDVCGAFAARKLAETLVAERNLSKVYTKLSWAPGEESPYLVEAVVPSFDGRLTNLSGLPPQDCFSIDFINREMHLAALDRKRMVRGGYMMEL